VPEGLTAFEAEHSWIEEGDAWMIARCFGKDRDNQIAISNPVFFDRYGWTPPPSAKAAVSIRVTDARTGRQSGAVCEAVEMIGREPRRLFRREIREGALQLELPATARLRVEAPGYKPLARSIFFDSAPILEATLQMRVEQMLDWSTYERMRRLLADVRLEFPLEAA
jgi:hypothetical protein